jgi:hypothetical protein
MFWLKNLFFTACRSSFRPCLYPVSYSPADLPINSNGVFDNAGSRYNVSLAVDDNGLFDVEAFKQYSPAYLAASNILLYGLFFAVYAATVSHAFLYHRKEIANGFKQLFSRKPLADMAKYDVHMRMMLKYPEVSELWYLGWVLLSFFSIVTTQD